jgi:hypothetical protein
MYFKPVSAHRAHGWGGTAPFDDDLLPPLDPWETWLYAAASASHALDAWRSAPDAEKAASYATYVEALDHEELVARLLAVRLEA